jgi:hypothetical protein
MDIGGKEILERKLERFTIGSTGSPKNPAPP